MFDYISGTLQTLSLNTCVVDTGGIGWSLNVSAKTAGHLSGQKEVRVYTHVFKIYLDTILLATT